MPLLIKLEQAMIVQLPVLHQEFLLKFILLLTISVIGVGKLICLVPGL